MSTENIKAFLQSSYSDEKLAALLAHAQDGKLAYKSCCCVAGIPSAVHALKGSGEGIHSSEHRPIHPMALPYPQCKLADRVSDEFCGLGYDDTHVNSDELRRERLIPLILAEMERRELLLRTLPDLPLSEQLRLEEEAAAEEGAAIEASGYMDPVYERNGR